MPSAKLANDSTPQVLRRSLPGLGTDGSRNGTARKFRAGLGSAGAPAPTNWQSASGRGRTHAVPAHRASRGRRGRRAAAERCRKGSPRRPWEAAHTPRMGAICGKVETQGESRKEVEEDLRIDNRKRNSLIFAVIEWVSAVDANNQIKDQDKLARSRRPTSVPSLPYDSCPSHDDLISRPFAGHDHRAKTEGHGDRHGRPPSLKTNERVGSHRGGQLPSSERDINLGMAVRE